MLLRKSILFSLLLIFSKSIVVSQDSSSHIFPKWHLKVLPLAFLNPVNPTVEVAFGTCLNKKTLVQTSFGYIDHFYNDIHTNRGFRTAFDVQMLSYGASKRRNLIYFIGAQLMYRQLNTNDLELVVDRFGGSYQQFFPFKIRQDSWYLHVTIGEYTLVSKHLYHNWKIALGGRTYREVDKTKLPEDAELANDNFRFGILDRPGEDWKLLPSLRVSLNIGFGW